jgi:hypothetical protein
MLDWKHLNGNQNFLNDSSRRCLREGNMTSQ